MLSTYIVQELHQQRIADFERRAALWRQLPPRRPRARRLRFSFPFHRHHPRFETSACR
jgi:hypothetical protein